METKVNRKNKMNKGGNELSQRDHLSRQSRLPLPRLRYLLGPAFIAAIAYVDPGNVAANITAGARYGYLLVWILVASNIFAMVVQYLSAKLGIVTGCSLPELLGQRLGKPARISFWLQAEVVAAATDLAEVIGGALALHLLFGIPLLWGGVIIGFVSLLLLLVQGRGYQRRFEALIIALLLVITLGFLAGLFVSPPDWAGAAGGLLPRFAGTDSILVAASMLGATVMPHVVYLHSSLVNDHEIAPSSHNLEPSRKSALGEGLSDSSASDRVPAGDGAAVSNSRVPSVCAEPSLSSSNRSKSSALASFVPVKSSAAIAHHLKATRIDILWALGLAGFVNIGLLLLAASALAIRR